MKLTINRDLLLKAVRRCDLKASATGNAALACVALHAKHIPDMPGGLDLKATNGLLGIATMVACATEEEESVAINCKQLGSAIANMPLGDLSLTTVHRGDTTRLTIRGGKRTWSEQTWPIADLKSPPDPPESGDRLKLAAPDLLALLDRTRFTIADVGGERPYAQGVYLDASAEMLDALVLGNHVWTRSTLPRRNPGSPFRVLLSEVVLPHVRDLALDAGNETIEVSRDHHFIWIENSSTLVVFPPPPGEYHDWRDLFERVQTSPICRLPRLAMLESLKAMLATSTSDPSRTWVRLLPTGELRLDYHDPKGETFFHDHVMVTDIQADARPVFMANAHHLLQTLDAAGGDVVLRYDHSSGQQIVLTTEDGFWCANNLFALEGAPPPLDGPDAPPAPPEAKSAPKRGGRKPQS